MTPTDENFAELADYFELDEYEKITARDILRDLEKCNDPRRREQLHINLGALLEKRINEHL